MVTLCFKTRYTCCADLMCHEHLWLLDTYSGVCLVSMCGCGDEKATGCLPRHGLTALFGSDPGPLTFNLETVAEVITDIGLSLTKNCQHTVSPGAPGLGALDSQEHEHWSSHYSDCQLASSLREGHGST